MGKLLKKKSKCGSDCDSPCDVHPKKMDEGGMVADGGGGDMSEGSSPEEMPENAASPEEAQGTEPGTEAEPEEAYGPAGNAGMPQEEGFSPLGELNKRMKGAGRGLTGLQDEDEVAKALRARKPRRQMMSKGGMVANKKGPGADKLPDDFDYLALSGGLEDKSGPGNQIGDGSLLEDMVSRVMLKRRKQHNPSPA